MKLLKYSWRLAIVAVFLLSLTLNIAFLVGGSIYKMASSALGAVSGIRTVAMQHADEVAQLGGDLAQERTARRKLTSELSDTTSDLAAERVVNRKLRGELVEATGSLATERLATQQLKREVGDPLTRRVVYRGEKVALRDAVDMTANRISKRAVVTSTREVGSMAGEAMPYIGVAVIVGVTALELNDLCATLKDMNELKRAMSLESTIGDDEKAVCAIKVPTKEELWETAKSSPGKAWSAARDAVPTLQEVKDIELPSIDWEQAWSVTTSTSSRAWEATKSGAATAVDASKSTGARAWGSLFGKDEEEASEDQ